MFPELPSIEQLALRTPSDISEHWAEVVKQVHQAGFVAVGNAGAASMVLVDAATFGLLRHSLNSFGSSLTPEKVDAVFAAKGKMRSPPKAGSSF